MARRILAHGRGRGRLRRGRARDRPSARTDDAEAIIKLRRRTGHPVLLVEDGRLLGIVDETEIIGALSPRHVAKMPA